MDRIIDKWELAGIITVALLFGFLFGFYACLMVTKSKVDHICQIPKCDPIIIYKQRNSIFDMPKSIQSNEDEI